MNPWKIAGWLLMASPLAAFLIVCAVFGGWEAFLAVVAALVGSGVLIAVIVGGINLLLKGDEIAAECGRREIWEYVPLSAPSLEATKRFDEATAGIDIDDVAMSDIRDSAPMRRQTTTWCSRCRCYGHYCGHNEEGV